MKDYTKFSNRRTEIKVAEENNVIAETEPVKLKSGIVTDCVRLNVRKNPDLNAEILCEVNCQTYLMIDEKESTDIFYKVYTAAGIEGFCMKDFITLLP